MKIFISWSGSRSRETADILSGWIRQVIQAADTWVSDYIDKGARWNDILNKELEETKFGIICLNKENLNANWLAFEAGALSKTKDAHVCTFLLDIKPTDVHPSLGQFQHTSVSKEEIKRLILTINSRILALNEKGLSVKDLDEIYETFWPRLETKLRSLQSSLPQEQLYQQPRTERDLLEEILQMVRSNNVPDNNLLLQNYLLTASEGITINPEGIKNSKVRYAFNDQYFIKLLVDSILKGERNETFIEASDKKIKNEGLAPDL